MEEVGREPVVGGAAVGGELERLLRVLDPFGPVVLVGRAVLLLGDVQRLGGAGMGLGEELMQVRRVGPALDVPVEERDGAVQVPRGLPLFDEPGRGGDGVFFLVGGRDLDALPGIPLGGRGLRGAAADGQHQDGG